MHGELAALVNGRPACTRKCFLASMTHARRSCWESIDRGQIFTLF